MRRTQAHFVRPGQSRLRSPREAAALKKTREVVTSARHADVAPTRNKRINAGCVPFYLSKALSLALAVRTICYPIG